MVLGKDVDAHLQALVHRNDAQRLGADAEHLDGLANAAVSFLGHVDDEPLVARLQPANAYVEAGFGMAGRGERRQVRHRSAAHEDAHGG